MSVIMSRPVHDPKYAGAEKETAAGVAAAKTVMSVGTYTNGTIPDIAVVGQGAPQLVQLCVRKDQWKVEPQLCLLLPDRQLISWHYSISASVETIL